MVRKLLLIAALAVFSALGVAPTAASARVIDCPTEGPCFCGEQISVGVPGKDPIISGNIDC